MADAADLKSAGATHVGSTPTSATMLILRETSSRAVVKGFAIWS